MIFPIIEEEYNGEDGYFAEYDANGNITSFEMKRRIVSEGTEGEWLNIKRINLTYDDVVTDFLTSTKTLYWNSEKGEYQETPTKLIEKTKKAPGEREINFDMGYFQSSFAPDYYKAQFYCNIKRDDQGRVISMEKYKLNGYAYINGNAIANYKPETVIKVSYAEDGTATIDFYCEDREAAAPAKNKIHKEVTEGSEGPTLHEQIKVKEWADFNGQILVDDPFSDLLEGNNRIKSAEYKWEGSEAFPYEVTYDDKGGFDAVVTYGEGEYDEMKKEILDDNDSYIFTRIWSEESDVDEETGNYLYWTSQIEVNYDDHDIQTKVLYKDIVNQYNSGNPKLYNDHAYEVEPTYDEDDNLTEIVGTFKYYTYYPSDDKYDVFSYYYFKETYDDFTEMEIEVNKINAVEKATTNDNAPMYNLAGQRVNDSYKGMVIQNGRKFMKK